MIMIDSTFLTGDEGAIVLFSGGQDSTTCLAWALAHFPRVETIGFSYGQRHAVELTCRKILLDRLLTIIPTWSTRLGADHIMDLSLPELISNTALTRDSAILQTANGLLSTFVPGRNLLFFTYAAATAWHRALRHLVGGMCETDYSGYPDCRDDTLKALQVTLNLGMARQFVLHTPLMWLDKAATWQLAESLGGVALVDLIRTDTHSCYHGDRTNLRAWGYGCGTCPACCLRAAGWTRYTEKREGKKYAVP
ncbi:Queuosine Biosynthesis QueC ATPase [invertebrate metagenome]|uniref:7-cyano-7-deazaguanine synthase n=1 Tax=invertebrate metagenome TaxID=1711999 RepID=A0A484H906_9ZZZZ